MTSDAGPSTLQSTLNEEAMPNIPDDVFSEPDSSPDTLANLGPLRRLAGVWASDQGVDINPKADGPERRVFREHIRMNPIDAQTNGPQLLYGLRYHIHINTPEEAITFHDQVGYWLWEPATGLIMQTIAIPRGQVVLAGGTAKPGGWDSSPAYAPRARPRPRDLGAVERRARLHGAGHSPRTGGSSAAGLVEAGRNS